MTVSLRTGVLAALLGSVAFLPLPSYALDNDVEIDTPGASVEVERDRPGILPRLRDDPDVYVETPAPDVYVEEEEGVPPGVTVEVDPE